MISETALNVAFCIMCVVVTAYGICYEDILPSLSEQDIFQTVALNSLGKGNNAV